ncbi:hypothetical protein DL240_16530 [Lujinxingia litoralis]|uniref:Dickkopf N-terminal cysteine-rich domain-containing protein n=1 Tax=Lujinxingia litoralis TaxID=2211119 RepID=A0A328C215_9DELT|nr:hypothetical protein [Lujinxingia litoralis]RAL20637.1 hypothetical protein DL240_16530 [Lujinxingia litoralis]
MKNLITFAMLTIALTSTTLACKSDASTTTKSAETTAEQSALAGETAPPEKAAPPEEAAPPEVAVTDETLGALNDPAMATMDCAELNAPACASNNDCDSDRVCFTSDDAPDAARCCVPGTRGSRQVGELCDEGVGSLQCASGICLWQSTIEGHRRVCSLPCTADADCPEVLPTCILGVCNSPTGD